tara:strand:+ start:749 stop:1117 length:369 start_codon:yes stop_codon:yes gene_type:complete
MEINFCNVCDNLLFLYSDGEDRQKLYLGCKKCGNQVEYTENKCIYNNEYQIDLSETINENKYLDYDVTLPSIKGNENIKCPNKDCESIQQDKPSDILYIKYDHNSMKYLYECKYCKQKWTNE